MQGPHLRKYGTQTTIDFTLYKLDGTGLKTDAAHATGDVKIMKNEGDEANTTNGFTDEGQGYSIVLTATEMEAARVVLYIVDQSSPQVWLDTTIVIDTYGNASAQHPFDLGTASTAQTGDSYARIGAAGAGLTAVPWNAAWDAEVQSECADALAAYDPPTNTEMEARTLVAANYATATNLAVVDTVVDGIVTTIGAAGAGLTALATQASVNTIDDFLDTEIAAILADTNELQTDWANGGRLDLLLDVASTPTAATIADAVWDEARADHTTGGTFGNGVASVAGSVVSVINNVNASVTAISANAITASSLATDAVAEIADAVWDEALSGHATAGTSGKKLTDLANADLSDVATATNLAVVDTVVDGIVTTIGAAGAGLTALATQASVNTIDDFLDTEIAAILADTNELQTDWANGGRLDLLLDAAGAGTISAAAMNQIADHVLRRSFASASASEDGDTKTFRSLLGAIAKLVNRIAAGGSTLTVYEADDATALGTQAITTSESAAPITELNTN